MSAMTPVSARRAARRPAYIVQPSELGLGQFQINRREFILELRLVPPAQDQRRKRSPRQLPRQRHLPGRNAPRVTHVDQRVDDIPQPRFIADRPYGPPS